MESSNATKTRGDSIKMKDKLKIKLNLCDITGGIEKYRSPEQKREIHKKNREVVFK